MNWQVNYAIENISQGLRNVTVEHVRDDAIRIVMPSKPDVIAVISAAYKIGIIEVVRYHEDFPNMDFLCGYRKLCIWEGEAIKYVEGKKIGWGSSGTLISAILKDEVNTAAHKDFYFAYRLIEQNRFITELDREFDRVFRVTLTNGNTLRVGMIMEYEPTADAIRTFWETFGPVDIAWNINPNGNPTQNAIEAGKDLGCMVVKWDELKELLRNRF